MQTIIRHVPTGNLGSRAPLRVLHISDLHASPFVSLSFLECVLRSALLLKPDLICLTGDFITFRVPCVEPYGAMLRLLSSSAPTFACFGNHDGGKWAMKGIGYDERPKLQNLLRAANIRALENESFNIAISDRTISIVGLDDIWAERFDAQKAFRQPGVGHDLRIVLSHNPDTKPLLEEYHWDILLCGHTHGGEVRLPFLGVPFAPVNDKRYVEGLHHENNRAIHITRGVGSLFGLRVNCAPEINLLIVT